MPRARLAALIMALSVNIGCGEPEEPAMFVREHVHNHAFSIRRFWPVRWALLNLGRDMKRARDHSGRYPHLWSLVAPRLYLDRRGPRSIDTPSASSWWIEEIGHRLVIEEADETHYLIRAYDVHHRLTWEIDECGSTRQLLPLHCHCHETRTEKEPVAFLKRAQHFFMLFSNAHDRYPVMWSETRQVAWHIHGVAELHWMNEDHLEDDPRGFPPKDATDEWKPNGSDFTYVLSNVGPHHYTIRSYNDLGLTDHSINRDQLKPKVIGSSESNADRLRAAGRP